MVPDAGCICMFEGLSSIERLWIMMLDVLSKPDVQPETPEELFDYILKQTAIPLESKSVVCVEDARAQPTAGTSVILIDGVARGLVLSTQSMQFRSVQEPSGEGNVRGSREGFTEPLRVNISLMRRLIRSGELMVGNNDCGGTYQNGNCAFIQHTACPEADAFHCEAQAGIG